MDAIWFSLNLAQIQQHMAVHVQRRSWLQILEHSSSLRFIKALQQGTYTGSISLLIGVAW